MFELQVFPRDSVLSVFNGIFFFNCFLSHSQFYPFTWMTKLMAKHWLGVMSVWSGLVNLDGNLVLLPRFASDSENWFCFCLFVCFLNNSALIDFSILNFRTLIFVISQAAMNGFWVVFEGIDKAPSDVQSILLPLLEGASSFLTSHGEVITLYLLPTCYVAHF